MRLNRRDLPESHPGFRYQMYLTIPGCIDTIELTSRSYNEMGERPKPETFSDAEAARNGP